MKTISSVSELVNVLSLAKCGGQFVTIYCEKQVRLNKFPTNKSADRVRISDGFAPRKEFACQFNFSADYERAMSKALGVDTYNSSDKNRVHLIKNVLMQYNSTKTICLIYMPKKYLYNRVTLNGNELSKSEQEYMAIYQPKDNASLLEYRTIGIDNVKRIAIGNEIYEISIK